MGTGYREWSLDSVVIFTHWVQMNTSAPCLQGKRHCLFYHGDSVHQAQNDSVVYNVLEKGKLKQENQLIGQHLNVSSKLFFFFFFFLRLSSELLLFRGGFILFSCCYKALQALSKVTVIQVKIMKLKIISEWKNNTTYISYLARKSFSGTIVKLFFFFVQVMFHQNECRKSILTKQCFLHQKQDSEDLAKLSDGEH